MTKIKFSLLILLVSIFGCYFYFKDRAPLGATTEKSSVMGWNISALSINNFTIPNPFKKVAPRTPQTLFTDCNNSEAIIHQLKVKLGNSLSNFELKRIDGAALVAQLDSGKATIPFVNTKKQLVSSELTTKSYSVRSVNVKAGFIKQRGSYRTSPLPTVLHYKLGLCTPIDRTCGEITVLDSNKTRFEGFILNKDIGFAFVEPADYLLRYLGDTSTKVDTNCHIMYNSAYHAEIPFPEDSTYPVGWNPPDLLSLFDSVAFKTARAEDMLNKTITMYLDSDQKFYSIDENTVWSRQESVFSSMDIIYGLIEPLTNGNFAINFDLKGQETWLPGFGPTEKDKKKLTDEINKSDYYMINHPGKNQVSFYYVGYDMNGGIAGVAGGVCNEAGYDNTFGSNEAHQRNHAWGQQVKDKDGGYQFSTLYGRIVVQNHEVGHMIGGRHEDGIANTCAAGLLDFLCGSTIMKSGAAGGVDPDFRQPFFSPKNSQNIKKCVDDAI